MTEQTIKVEGLPEGWRTVRYGWPKKNVDHVFDGIGVNLFLGKEDHAMLIVEKIQPSMRVLDENILNDVCWVFVENYVKVIGEQYSGNLFNNIKPLLRIVIESYLEKQQVKETLTNNEPKLSLTKKDMLDLIEHIKLGGQFNSKIAEFIDYDQPEPKLSLSLEQCKKFFNGTIRGRLEVVHIIEDFVKGK